VTVKAALIPVPAILLVALTACSPGGGGGGGGGGSTDAPDPSGGDTACVTGLWTADTADLAAQIGDYLSGTGLPISSSTASGQQQLALDEQGYAGMASTDLTFVISAELSDGLTETITQTHNGTFRGNWGWDSGTVLGFSDITDEGYQVENTVDIEGRTVDIPIDIPVTGMTDVPLTVSCSGDTMTTKADQSPFTTTWHREGDAVDLG
jgi:hypothetical protein